MTLANIGANAALSNHSLESLTQSVNVARTLTDALDAWRLVYDVYHDHGLIDANEHQLHTHAQIVQNDSAVFVHRIGSSLQATLTAVCDGPGGLPLEQVYPREIEALRRRTGRLMEVGLLADRGRKSLTALVKRVARCRRLQPYVELMRHAFSFSQRDDGLADYVVGVHPRHARFYIGAFGFEEIGPARTYPSLRNRPVTLLHADPVKAMSRNPLPFALEYAMARPVPMESFVRVEMASAAMGEGGAARRLREYLGQARG